MSLRINFKSPSAHYTILIDLLLINSALKCFFLSKNGLDFETLASGKDPSGKDNFVFLSCNYNITTSYLTLYPPCEKPCGSHETILNSVIRSVRHGIGAQE